MTHTDIWQVMYLLIQVIVLVELLKRSQITLFLISKYVYSIIAFYIRILIKFAIGVYIRAVFIYNYSYKYYAVICIHRDR